MWVLLNFFTAICIIEYFLRTHREDIDEMLGLVSLVMLVLCAVGA